ncbi:MAG: class I SAM-dependent methyltransferase [bacterium]|nr:class I SAM-dependent methyltransferase [bacterium]
MYDNVRSLLIQKRGYREDIAGDALSLYLSNNPTAAKWLGERIGNTNKILLELCCAVGVTLERLAPVFKGAIGVDIDKKVLEACRENLEKAGLLEKVKLVLGDVTDTDLLKSIAADIVIYDIPYWYPEKYPNYSAEKRSLVNPDLAKLISDIKEFITNDIVIFAPKEMDYEYFKGVLGECECDEIFVNGKHGRNCIFLGSLIKKKGLHRVDL